MEKPIIDHTIDEKIDTKIEAAQIVPTTDPTASKPPTTTAEEDLRKGQAAGWTTVRSMNR